MDGHRRTQADAGRTPGRTDPYGLPDKSIDTSFDRLTQRQYCDMGGVGQGSSGGAAQQEGAWGAAALACAVGTHLELCGGREMGVEE
eukprot:365988-Chlamydomonas_euryale.AAC.8